MSDNSSARALAQPTLHAQIGGFAIAVALVAGATIVGLAIAPGWGQAPVVLLFLPAVLAAAFAGGRWPAMFAAVGATLAYNYFFTEPYHTLAIHDAGDILTVVILLLAGVMTSHLASSLRVQAQLASAHAARNATIAGLARELLGCASEGEIARVTACDFARVFDCYAVVIAGADEPQVVASNPEGARLAPSDLAAAALTLTTGQASGRGVRKVDLADWQFRPVTGPQAVIAAVGLARSDGSPPIAEHQERLVASMLDQIALALERARLENEARAHAALRERDRMRSVLLASIGEDVKPRLRAIAAAARALKRDSGNPKPSLAAITGETAKLERYVDHLVDLEPGIEPEPVRVGEVTIDLLHRRVTRQGELVHLTPREFGVIAELARHAGRVLTHAQLLRSVWGPAHAGHVDYLRVAVSALRQKLEDTPSEPALILNEPAVGYRLARI